MDINQLKLTADETLLSAHFKYLHSGYKEILAKHKIGGIFLHRGVVRPKYSLDDYEWPLSLTPHYLHWAPDASLEGGILVTENYACLFQVPHNNYWEGPAPKLVDNPFLEKQTIAELNKIPFPELTAFVGDDVELSHQLGVNLATENLLADLNALRTRKTCYELKCLIEATEIALAAHRSIRDKFMAGAAASEFSLHLDYLSTTQQSLFATPYQPIVAFGRNAAILHHVYYSNKVDQEKDQSLLLDAGASVRYYASDITRTYCRGESKDSKLFQDLISALDKTQQKIGREFKIGKPFEELHNETHLALGKILVEAEILRNISAAEAVEKGFTRIFLPHGLGHSLGIQVHDVGMKLKKPAANNPYLRNTAVIQEGQVCTIEPGIYFIDSLLTKIADSANVNWPVVEKLKKFGGIRIEDNIYSSSDGPINLTRSSLLN